MTRPTITCRAPDDVVRCVMDTLAQLGIVLTSDMMREVEYYAREVHFSADAILNFYV